jgi:hypothetical protein
MELSKFIHTMTMQPEIKRNKDKRPGIIIIGDSHTRGCAGDLLHQVKQQYKSDGIHKTQCWVNRTAKHS